MTFLNRRAPSGHRICKNLRCKEMYYEAVLEEDRRRSLVTDPEDDRHVYWCAKTARQRGPEHGEVSMEVCNPERSCYEG